jgi:hypothetical protein
MPIRPEPTMPDSNLQKSVAKALAEIEKLEKSHQHGNLTRLLSTINKIKQRSDLMEKPEIAAQVKRASAALAKACIPALPPTKPAKKFKQTVRNFFSLLRPARTRQ